MYDFVPKIRLYASYLSRFMTAAPTEEEKITLLVDFVVISLNVLYLAVVLDPEHIT